MGRSATSFLNYERSGFTAAAPVFFVLFGLIALMVFWGNFTMDQGPLDTYREFGVPMTGVVKQSVATADAGTSSVGHGSSAEGDYRQWPFLMVQLDHPPAVDHFQNGLIGLDVNTRTAAGQRLVPGDRVTVLRSYAESDHDYAYILPGDKPLLARHLERLFLVSVLPFVVIEIFWLMVSVVHVRRGFRISAGVGRRRLRSVGVMVLLGLGCVVAIFAQTWAAFS